MTISQMSGVVIFTLFLTFASVLSEVKVIHVKFNRERADYNDSI